MKKILQYINIRISIYWLIIASIVSTIGDWIYPNLIFVYGLTGLYLLFAFATPVLIIWLGYNISNSIRLNRLLRYLISIWIGLFVSFFFPHLLINKVGDYYWKTAAIKTEQYIDSYYSLYENHPDDIKLLFDSSLVKENFIFDRYINLIQINLSDSLIEEFPHYNKYGYELGTGFWIADFRSWNPETREWKSIF